MADEAFLGLYADIVEVARGFTILSRYTSGLRERLAAQRPEWNGKIDARSLAQSWPHSFEQFSRFVRWNSCSGLRSHG